MRSRVVSIVVLALVLMAACDGASRKPVREDELVRYLLSDADAPLGTRLNADGSGPQTLEQYAEDDAIKKRDLEAAGFVTSHFRLFLSPEVFEPSKKGTLAISFAILFKDAAGASQGLQVVRSAVFRDGRDLKARADPAMGDESFELSGVLQQDLPPGYLFAWRVRNVVLGLVAAGSEGVVAEPAARALADRMLARAA